MDALRVLAMLMVVLLHINGFDGVAKSHLLITPLIKYK